MNPISSSLLPNPGNAFTRFLTLQIPLPEVKPSFNFRLPARRIKPKVNAIVLDGFWYGFSLLFLYFFILPVLVADTILFLLT